MEQMELLRGQHGPATGMGINSRLGTAPWGLSCCSHHPGPAVPLPGVGDPPVRAALPHGGQSQHLLPQQ